MVGASFSWEMLPKEAGLGGGADSLHSWPGENEGRRSSLLLRDIDVSIPEGKLTVVHGEVGSGAALLAAHAFKASNRTYLVLSYPENNFVCVLFRKTSFVKLTLPKY